MKDFEQLGFDISVHHGVCSVNEHSESHYNLQNTSFAAVERDKKQLTPTKRVSRFLPLSRLFCTAVFHLQNILTEPLKKSMLN